MSVIRFPARLRAVPSLPCSPYLEQPPRDIADLPPDLRERVLAARGVESPDRDPPPSAA